MAHIPFLSRIVICLFAAMMTRSGLDRQGGDQNRPVVGTNAEATADPSVFVMMRPMLSEGLSVKIQPQEGRGAGRELTRGQDYLYDEEQGKIVLLGDVIVDSSTQMLFVRGQIRDPSTFFFHHPISSVGLKVVLGDRRLVLGDGFQVNEREGILRILDAEMRQPGARYFISAGDQAIGNRSDMDVVNRLLEEQPPSGQHSTPAASSARIHSVGTNAEATVDPHRFVLMQPMLSEGLLVKIIARGRAGGESRDLARGPDYLYDPELGELVLFGDLSVDPTKQLLFVSGQIRDPSKFFFHHPFTKADVKVILNDRRLVVDEDFEVDEHQGIIHILAKDIGSPDAKFYVSAGDRSMTNGANMDVVRELLDKGSPRRKGLR